MKYNRGGKSLCVGDIGRMKVLRQHILLPNERLDTSIRGNVRLSGLRQQTSVYLHASIEAFAAPLRWYWDEWTDYLQEGISTAKTVPTLTGWGVDPKQTTNLGIGRVTSDFAKWYAQHPINVWNEWYRWPEDAKENVDTPNSAFFAFHGKPVVNLPSAATRLHTQPTFDGSEYTQASVSNFNVRDLAKVQSRLGQAAKRDWTSQTRYKAFMKDIFGAQGSNEVDKVPIRLQKGAELSVMPKDMYATDGPSLGEIMSINNFQVSHRWNNFVAQEHMIVCYVMVLRFAPIFAEGVAPGIYPGDTPYEIIQGDKNLIETLPPTDVKSREIENGTGSVIGYLPAGWQYREGFNHVDHHIAALQNFPIFDGHPMTAAGHRDATHVGAAFRSAALRHWFADLDFNVEVESMVPTAGESIIAGAHGTSAPKGNHPTGGYVT